MASPSSSSKCVWKKDSKLAKVKIEVEKAEAEDKVTIQNEVFENPIVVEQGIEIINLKCSAKLCVNGDDPCMGEFVEQPAGASGK